MYFPTHCITYLIAGEIDERRQNKLVTEVGNKNEISLWASYAIRHYTLPQKYSVSQKSKMILMKMSLYWAIRSDSPLRSVFRDLSNVNYFL